MKQKLQIALTIVALLAMLATATVSAQYTGYSWTTTYQVVNMGTTDATVTVDYYDASGNPVSAAQKNFTLGAGKSKVVVQLTDDTALGNGRFSAVISSNQPVAAVVNQQLVPDGSTSLNSTPPFSSYSGASAGSTTVTLPQLMYNWYGYYTDVIVQNVGTGAASNISIAYTPTTIGGAVAGATGQTDTIASLAQYAATTVSQQSASKLGAASGTFAGRFFGSATITSGQPIVAIVNQQKVATSGTQPAGKLMTYNGFSAGSTSASLPQHLRGWYGYYGSLLIANPSTTTAADVTITYTPDKNFSQMAGVPTVTVNHSVPAGQSLNRYDGSTATAAQSDLLTNGVNQFIGGVKVTSNIPVVVQENLETAKQAGSYNGVPTSEATTTAVVPLIQADFYGFYTSLNVQNTTATAGSCTITYYSDDTYSSVKNASKAYTHAITANGTFTVYESASQGDVHMDPTTWTSGGQRRFLGSATVSCTVPVVAFVNSESNAASGDSIYTFNTFNK